VNAKILPAEDDLKALFQATRTIAVVGASGNEHKQSHRIPAYLQSQGYRVIPVNPGAQTILGERAVATLTDISEPVDVVDVFRPSHEAPGIARRAVEIGARALWLQLGIESEEAAEIARAGGMVVVMNACMGAIHRKLMKHGEPLAGGA
jgi:predicted CoA-binding protein